MRKIFLSAGHSNLKGKDMGASGNGFIEGLLAVEFRTLLDKELKAIGVTPVLDSNENALDKTLAYFKNMVSSESIVIDIHWNASSNSLATGVEVLVPAEYSSFEYALASIIANRIAVTLGLKTRGTNGVKTELESHHGRLGWMRLKGENILIEMCFITNSSDMTKYQKNKHILAKELANTIKKYT